MTVSHTVAGAAAAGAERGFACARTGLFVSIHELPTSAEISAEWRDLASRALVPNLFYEADFANAAAVPFGKGVRVVLARNAAGQLVLAWPFRLSRTRWGLPLAGLVGWMHPFASLGVPLLDAAEAKEALICLLNVHHSIRGLPPRAFLPQVPEDGPFAQVLDLAMRELGLRSATLERYERASWTKDVDGDAYAILSSGSRSKLRQEYRRLEREGTLVFETLTEPDDVERGLEDYLKLEALGWKGRMGTAIPQSAEEMAFMRRAVRDYARQGRVRIDQLRIGPTTLASSITYLSGTHAWYAKISFNETFARNSPGSQLVLKVTEQWNAGQMILTADSCAPPGHPLMRRFWGGRFWLANRVVELHGGDRLFPLACRLETLRTKVREFKDRASAARQRTVKNEKAPAPRKDQA